MGADTHLMIPEAERVIEESGWRIRRALASMEAEGIEIPRYGRFRLIPRELLPRLREQIRREKKFQRVDTPSMESSAAG